MAGNERKRVCVVVLGDIGRSPRMQYHSMSLASAGFDVDFVGYTESKVPNRLLENERINVSALKAPPPFNKYLPRLATYALKAIWQSVNLMFSLCCLSKPSHLLVQNPPSVPTLAVAWIYCSIRRVRLIVDWHNYGFSIMALALSNTHRLVKFSKWFERYFGSKAHGHFTVTRAMKEDLDLNWGISDNCTTLYDRPQREFAPATVDEIHDLFVKLSAEYACFRHPNEQEYPSSSIFTEKSNDGSVTLRSERPVLLVSSTSWTEDEDFSILLNALERYDKTVVTKTHELPKILCVVTGKGPMKEFYVEEIARKSLANVQFCTPWLSAEDYPKLLGCADLGVCLHVSSSGLDLPMKVVDMFGCGIPVCAVSYNCLDELVKHSQNGMVFSNFHELAGQLESLLIGFPSDCPELLRLEGNVLASRDPRWDDNWTERALPLFT